MSIRRFLSYEYLTREHLIGFDKYKVNKHARQTDSTIIDLMSLCSLFSLLAVQLCGQLAHFTICHASAVGQNGEDLSEMVGAQSDHDERLRLPYRTVHIVCQVRLQLLWMVRVERDVCERRSRAQLDAASIALSDQH